MKGGDEIAKEIHWRKIDDAENITRPGLSVSQREFENMRFRSDLKEEYVTHWAEDEHGIARPVGGHTNYYDKKGRMLFIEDD